MHNSQDLYVAAHDADTTFTLAMHHLLLAAALFDRLTPEEFADVQERAVAPGEIRRLLAAVSGQMQTDAWLRDLKQQAAEEMTQFLENDLAAQPVWDRYETMIRERLAAEGESEDTIEMENGDMAAVVQEYRDGGPVAPA